MFDIEMAHEMELNKDVPSGLFVVVFVVFVCFGAINQISGDTL